MKHLDGGTDKVLLATDFSQPSKRAFDAAIRACRALEAKLYILHVNEEETIFSGHSSDELTHFMDDIVKRRAGWMANFERSARELGVPAESIMKEGKPAETIISVADSIDVGLIVMGTQGARGIGSVLPGSVAKKTLRRAERPVLLVSRMAGVAPAEAGGSFEHIAYPTDFSEASRAGFAVAKMMVDKTGARLTLVNILRLPRFIPSLPGEPPIMLPREPTEKIQDKLRSQLAEMIKGVGDRVDAEVGVHADPAQGIADIVSQSGIDLIVIPRHSSHNVSGALFGTTAENLAKIATVPVLLFSPGV